ncbi:LytR/AlgR family response regulator transcription factor [Clostridium oryzae]|uniref:Stage 0 sporulation protein A homolog n=1 Tax=Clostridium oryzae TaxID=1450648 RepID=A0A1V4IX24_9CLOT|nr:LytTR family DNA-binding domain-containing protein [Clostridium oryzae]OPJ64380.1 transcriptional regulatory protein YehT [Clostridium oryzae]
MLNIAIVDDENVQALLLSKMVNQWVLNNNKTATIKLFSNSESFYFAWCEDKSFDILLLDIQMKGMNGIELAKEIRKTDDKLSLIFVTGLSDYMNLGYDVSALHYLIKPVDETKLFSCLDKACGRIRKEPSFIVVTTEGENVRIPKSEIVSAEAFGHYIKLETLKASYEIKLNISELEKVLDKDYFIRCHRSYIAGIRYISKIGKKELTLENGRNIPVSRSLYHSVNQAFIKFFKEADL